MDPYAVLGLQPGATKAEIKKAFRQKAMAHHPDMCALLLRRCLVELVLVVRLPGWQLLLHNPACWLEAENSLAYICGGGIPSPAFAKLAPCLCCPKMCRHTAAS